VVVVAAGVEPVGVECGAEHFDLRAGGDVFRFADVFEDVGGDHAGQDGDDDDNHEDFDEREAGPCEADSHASTLARGGATRNPNCYGGGESVELRTGSTYHGDALQGVVGIQRRYPATQGT